jgi:hypothetical protein
VLFEKTRTVIGKLLQDNLWRKFKKGRFQMWESGDYGVCVYGRPSLCARH